MNLGTKGCPECGCQMLIEVFPDETEREYCPDCERTAALSKLQDAAKCSGCGRESPPCPDCDDYVPRSMLDDIERQRDTALLKLQQCERMRDIAMDNAEGFKAKLQKAENEAATWRAHFHKPAEDTIAELEGKLDAERERADRYERAFNVDLERCRLQNCLNAYGDTIRDLQSRLDTALKDVAHFQKLAYEQSCEREQTSKLVSALEARIESLTAVETPVPFEAVLSCAMEGCGTQLRITSDKPFELGDAPWMCPACNPVWPGAVEKLVPRSEDDRKARIGISRDEWPSEPHPADCICEDCTDNADLRRSE